MHKRLFNPIKSNSYFLFGQRGSGKSFLIKNSLKERNDVTYIDLLSDKEYFRFKNNPDQLLDIAESTLKKIVVIDEVQRVPAILNQIHKLIEDKNIQFILSGSSSRKLKREGANMLAGRAFQYKLFPYSYLELGEKFNLLTYLTVGGLPKVYTFEADIDRYEYLYSYVNTYLEEEIKVEQSVRKLDPFLNFMRVSAQLNGQLINLESIARDTNLTRATATQYFQILVDSYIGYFLEPYNKSIRKRQKTKPKFYFYDIGILRTLQNLIELPVITASFEYGILFETFLINEIIKLSEYKRKRYVFSFIRDSNDKEIDLIIERPGLPTILLEIKSKNNIDSRDLSTINSFYKRFSNAKAYCFSNDQLSKKIENVECLYWKDGLQELELVED